MILPLKAFETNYIWIITNEIDSNFICVDPGEAEPVLTYASQQHLHLKAILLTHHHADHIGGVLELIKHFPDVVIYAPNDARFSFKVQVVLDEYMIQLEPFAFRVIQTPGHTSSHICYQEIHYAWLFCGDTLFSAGCGRVFDGSMEQLFHSLQILKKLPDETKIFCAHEYTKQNLRFAKTIEPDNQAITRYLHQLETQPNPITLPSTMGMERQINPFLRTEEADVIRFATQNHIPHDSFAIFKALRQLKDQFK